MSLSTLIDENARIASDLISSQPGWDRDSADRLIMSIQSPLLSTEALPLAPLFQPCGAHHYIVFDDTRIVCAQCGDTRVVGG